MAAGDVTMGPVLTGHHGMLGKAVVSGSVQLDGANPTPVALAAYLDSLDFAMCALVGDGSAPGDDPTFVDWQISGTTINVYAWKNTGGTDPTLVASTDATHSVAFFAIGNKTRT